MVKSNEKQLIVEGKDDFHVISAICKNFSITENFKIFDCEGIDNLYEEISVRFKQSELTTLGIIIDADTDIQCRWLDLKRLLTSQGFVVPDSIPKEGLVIENAENKKAGIWVMPDNELNGILEDFICFLVPENDELLPIVDSNLKSIEDNTLHKYDLKDKTKARIHTWLAWQKDPGTPMGLAITKKILAPDKNVYAESLVKWLVKLFS